MTSATPPALDISPPIHRFESATQQFDPSIFHRRIPVLAARISASQTTAVTKNDPIKGFLLNIPKIKTVLPDPEDNRKRLVLLRVAEKEGLSEEAREYLSANAESLVPHTVDLDYSYWTSDEILNAILPADLVDESPTSFTITGHIAHFNLREEYLPWKHLIGKIVLDKNKHLRTVVNKLDNIDTEFRFFKMEVLAGDPDFIVDVSESNCRFKFDFSQVYWNSRLHSEHERLVKRFKEDDVVADVFAGVGPFAVPAAKKGCAVFGNDLNPNSARYMLANSIENKVESRLRVSCKDGREFIRSVAHESWHNPFPALAGPLKTPRQLEREERHRRNEAAKAKTTENPSEPAASPASAAPISSAPEIAPPPPPRRAITHFVMNLPGTALEFLDAFRGSLSSIASDPSFSTIYARMPLVHTHCFTRELEEDKAKADILQRAESALGGKIGEEELEFHFVRAVAPNKDMWCITFRLPRELAVEPSPPSVEA